MAQEQFCDYCFPQFCDVWKRKSQWLTPSQYTGKKANTTDATDSLLQELICFSSIFRADSKAVFQSSKIKIVASTLCQNKKNYINIESCIHGHYKENKRAVIIKT